MTKLESGYVLDGMNEFERNVKRLIDMFVAFVCLILFSPLLADLSTSTSFAACTRMPKKTDQHSINTRTTNG